MNYFISFNMVESYQENLFNNSNYNYNINENEDKIFIFELIFKNFNSKNNKLRLIKKSNNGKLLTYTDGFIYDTTKKINITIIDINNPLNHINIDCLLNQSSKYTLLLNNNISIEFYENKGILESNYNIIDI